MRNRRLRSTTIVVAALSVALYSILFVLQCSMQDNPVEPQAVITDPSTTGMTVLRIVGNNKPPTVSLTSPANNAKFRLTDSVVIMATAKAFGDSLHDVALYDQNGFPHDTNVGPWRYVIHGFDAPGSYPLYAIAEDDTGCATMSASVTIIVRNCVPSVKIDTPKTATTFPVLDTIRVVAKAFDTDGTISKVRFYHDSISSVSIFDSTTVGGDSLYYGHWNAAPAGKYKLLAVALDNLGATKTSTSVVSITVRNRLPSVKVTAPLTGATFHLDTPVTITAQVHDSDNTLKKVYFYSDTSHVIDSAVAGDTSTYDHYSIVWRNFTAGKYNIFAKVKDKYDSTRISTKIAVTVTDLLPTSKITLPKTGTRFALYNSIVIRDSATDKDDGMKRVKFYRTLGAVDSLVGIDSTSTPPIFTTTWSHVPAGTYTIKAVSFDDAGDSTKATAISVTVRNRLPSVKLLSPATGGTYGVDDTVIVLKAQVHDSDNTLRKVYFRDSTGIIDSVNAGDTTTYDVYQITVDSVPAGKYTVWAQVKDMWDSTRASSSVKITVRNKAPTAAFILPTANKVYNYGDSVVVKAVASDTDGTIQTFVLGKVQGHSTDTAAIAGAVHLSVHKDTLSCTLRGLPPDTFHLVAVTVDNNDTVRYAKPITFYVTDKTPTVKLTVPVASAKYKTTDSVLLKAVASDALDPVKKVSFYDGATLIGVDSTSPMPDTFKYMWRGLTAGSHTIKATAADSFGLTASATAAVTVATDNPPAAVTLSAPTAIGNDTMKISWTKNSETDFKEYLVYSDTVSIPSTPLLSELDTTITSASTISLIDRGQTTGKTYYFQVYVVDMALQKTGSAIVHATAVGP